MHASPLAQRLLDLAQVLRRAGVALGSGEVLTALRAAEAVGIERAQDLRAALAATLIHRPEDRALFDAAFGAVLLAAQGPAEGAPQVPAPRPQGASNRRLAAALAPDRPAPARAFAHGEHLIRAPSDVETLRHRDFDEMSADEARAALELVRRAARWWRLPSRRRRASARGRELDARRTLRELARRPDAAVPYWRARRDRPSRLVLVCDVSGSMHAYCRAFLQLAHALAGRDRAVELFAFATRLTRLTPLLRERDADRSLARIGAAVPDFDSGTRIGEALGSLVRDFGAAVLGAHSLVVLLTDGLERGSPQELRAAAWRLRRSCREVLWLNPLLRFAEYAPLARGAAALAETLEEIRPAHDPASLEALMRSLEALRR